MRSKKAVVETDDGIELLKNISNKMDKLVENQELIITLLSNTSFSNTISFDKSNETKVKKKQLGHVDESYIPDVNVKGRIRADTKSTAVSSSDIQSSLDAMDKHLGEK